MSGAIQTRLLKAQCGTCAYTVRVTRRWLAEGRPRCHCNSEPMECAQWEDIEERCREEMEAWEAEALTVSARVLRERWVRARIAHACTRCRGVIPIGEEYLRTETACGEELVTEKQCLACKLRQTPQSVGRGAVGCA